MPYMNMMAGGDFPATLSVLVVDGDPSCLNDLQNILNKYYQVKTSSSAKEAADMLTRKNERFDMVISDVNMSDMNDGFVFIRHVANKHIPIIMMSKDDETNKVMKGFQCGACHFLLKPIEPKDVQFIWQHVYRKRISHQIDRGEETGMVGLIARNKRGGESGGASSSHVDIKPKKFRLAWTEERKKMFEKAVEQCGPDKIGPKKILELMGDKSITRGNIASYLQKYRRRNAEKEVPTNIHPQEQPLDILPNRNMHIKIQNQVASQISHYRGQNIQNQDLLIQNQVARPINHYQSGKSFQIQNQVTRRINHYPGGQNYYQIPNRDFHIQNQVTYQSNNYPGLDQLYSGNSLSQAQYESRIPQPAQVYSVLLDERFHGPPQMTGYPAVQEHISHTTMELSDVIDPHNRFMCHPHSANFNDVTEPVSFTSRLSNMDEQNLEINVYPLDQINPLLLPANDSDPNDGGNDPSNSVIDLAHTYTKNDSDS